MAIDETKPHHGQIVNWWRARGVTWQGLGYLVCGNFERFAGREGHTSWVVAEEDGEVETRNSRYTLVGPERSDDDMGIGL